MKSLKTAIFYAVLLFLVFTSQADAYLDPGTGSYVLQIVAAAFLAGTVLIKGFWGNIKDVIDKLFMRKGKNSENGSSKNK